MHYRAWQFESSRHLVGLWLVLAGAVLVSAQTASAQGRSLRVAVVLSSAAKPYAATWAKAESQLKTAGHKPQMILLESIKQPETSLPDVDAYLAVGSPAAIWLDAKLSKKTPLVYCMVAWPEDTSLADKTPRPGVGATVPIASQLKLIARVLRAKQKVGLLTRSDSEHSRRIIKGIESSMPRDWQIAAVAVDKHKTPADAINALMDKKPTMVLATVDSKVYSVPVIRTLLLHALRHRVAVMGFSAGFVQAGALFGTDIDPACQASQAVTLLDKLYGAGQSAGGKNHVPQPPKFDIAVNQIVADRIGRKLPRELVESAKYVFAKEKK